MEKNNVLVSAYLDLNLGDDLIICELLETFPDYNFYFLGCKGNSDKPFKRYKNFNKISYIKLISKIDKFNSFLIIGGSIFQDNPKLYKFYYRRLIIKRIFNYMKKKIFIIDCNFDKKYTSRGMNILKNTLREIDLITVRDVKSYELLKKLDINSKFKLFPDLIFYSKNKILRSSRSISRKKTLGISIINLNQNKDIKREYLDNLCKIIKEFNKKAPSGKVVIFAFESGKINDERLVDELITKFRGIHLNITKKVYSGNPNSFLKEFKKCDFIISGRFHSIVLAMKLKIPVIPLINSQKVINLLSDAKYSGLKLNYQGKPSMPLNKIFKTAQIINFKIFINEGHFEELKKSI